MRGVTEQLASSVETEPPPSLRSAVLTGISTTTQEASADDSAQSGRTAAGGRATVSRLDVRRRGWLPYLAAAAAVLAAVGFAGWGLQSRHDAQQAAARQNALVQLLGSRDVRTVTGTAHNGGSGTVVLSRSLDRAVFVANRFPTLPAGKVYELWTMGSAGRPGTPVPAGTFTSAGSVTTVSLPSAAVHAGRVAVTVEPAGGSAHPTSSPVLSVPVATSS